MKSYDILKVYFKFKVGRITVQFRKLRMLSEALGITYVFTVSSDVRLEVMSDVPAEELEMDARCHRSNLTRAELDHYAKVPFEGVST